MKAITDFIGGLLGITVLLLIWVMVVGLIKFVWNLWWT